MTKQEYEEKYIKDTCYSEKDGVVSLVLKNPISDSDYIINLRSLATENGIILETGYVGYPDYTNNLILSQDQVSQLVESINKISKNSEILNTKVRDSKKAIETIEYYINNKYVTGLHIIPKQITTLDIGTELFGRIVLRIHLTYRDSNSLSSKVNTFKTTVLSDPIRYKTDYTRLFVSKISKLKDKKFITKIEDIDTLKGMCNAILDTIDPVLPKIE